MAERRRRSEAQEPSDVPEEESTQKDVDEKSAMLLQIYSKAEKQAVQQST